MGKRIVAILVAAILGCNILILANAKLKKENLEFARGENIKRNTASISNAEKATSSNILERNGDKAEEKEDSICKVSFPTNTKAYLDPGDVKGKGQVFSDSYMVENYGNSDIAVKIKNIDIIYQGIEIENDVLEEDIASHSNAKKINIKMVWKNEADQTEKILSVENGSPNQYVLFLKGAKYNKNNEYVSLNDSSKGLFYFTGTLSSDPEIDWENCSISVNFDYEIEIEESDDEVNEGLS